MTTIGKSLSRPTGARPHAWLRAALAMFVVGWGANQFAPLLLAYQEQSHLTQASVSAMFGVYAVGLIPALLVAARLSDRLGRRRVIRPVLIVSALSSVVLIIGVHQEWALFAGRLLAGVASGAAFGPGSAWIKELSEGGPVGSGSRRATVAVSAGFGGGPLVAGLIAQWLPDPEVLPYVVHIALVLVIAPLVWVAPETVGCPGRQESPSRPTSVRASLMHSHFLRRVLPTAPWVFGTASVSFAVLPGMVAADGKGLMVSGAAAGLTLGTGVLLQPLARRLEAHRPGWTFRVGMLVAVAGMALAAATAATANLLVLAVAAIFLGGAYGMLMVAGLAQAEALADADDLATVTGVFYCLAYLGFAAPFLIVVLRPLLPPAELFCIAAAAALLTVPMTMARPMSPEPKAAD
ncbi:MFS transporter [Streptomyces kronopolitis]|uniref:MFS transporter n=1 Tax=Streptomyces kronopolitis TaxID=1612435 RepID=UPI00369135DE